MAGGDAEAQTGAVTAFPRLALFARYPVAGEAKTRLIPAVGCKRAAEIHRVLTERTIALLQEQRDCTVELFYTGAPESAFRNWLGEGFFLREQVEGGLTERLLAALDPVPVIFFGADTPDLAPSHVAAAVAALTTHDVVIGPADDGGYYLIGFRQPYRFLLTDMPWSTARVWPETLRRLDAHGVVPAMLEPLGDCDRPEDLVRWPWLIPST